MEHRQGAYIPCRAFSFFLSVYFFPPFCFWLESLVISTNLFGHEQGGRERVKSVMLGFHGPGGKSAWGGRLVSEVRSSGERSQVAEMSSAVLKVSVCKLVS